MNTSEMNDAQVAGLASAIIATAEAMGQEMNPGTAAMMAEDLCVYSVPVVRAALKACRLEVKGRLSMADILQRVQSADGRPGKDEAWSIALTGSDELETVVMTSEIQQAMVAARPVLKLGDKVGARMAFNSAYERLVAGARAEAVPTAWSVSLGFDQARRVAAIEQAVQMKRLSLEDANDQLLRLNLEPVTQDGQAIAGLLTGSTVEPSPHLREKLAEVRQIVDAAKARQKLERLKKAQADRVDTYLRKRKFRASIAAAQCKEASHG